MLLFGNVSRVSFDNNLSDSDNLAVSDHYHLPSHYDAFLYPLAGHMNNYSLSRIVLVSYIISVIVSLSGIVFVCSIILFIRSAICLRIFLKLATAVLSVRMSPVPSVPLGLI